MFQYYYVKIYKLSVLFDFVILFYFEQSGLEPWLATLYYVHEQDT